MKAKKNVPTPLTIRQRRDLPFTLWFSNGKSIRVYGRNQIDVYSRLPVEWKIAASHLSGA